MKCILIIENYCYVEMHRHKIVSWPVSLSNCVNLKSEIEQVATEPFLNNWIVSLNAMSNDMFKFLLQLDQDDE